MRMPGFSAAASIYRSGHQYRAHGRHTPSEAQTIEPANRVGSLKQRGLLGWGDLHRGDCTGDLIREYDATYTVGPGSGLPPCTVATHFEMGQPHRCTYLGRTPAPWYFHRYLAQWWVDDPTCSTEPPVQCPPGYYWTENPGVPGCGFCYSFDPFEPGFPHPPGCPEAP